MRFLPLSLVLLLGCSDFECPEARERVGGTCVQSSDRLFDPEPRTKVIPMACDGTQFPEDGVGWGWLAWELTVDPTAIRSGENFAAEFEAVAIFPEFFVKQSQATFTGGLSRVQALDLRATVLVRRGAEDPKPVLLTFDRESIPWTCRYDTGGSEVGEGVFPTCLPENDESDGSNEECIGLAGKPDPEDRCGQFIPIPTSGDCDPGGVCESVVYDVPGVGWTAMEMCQRNGFCVTGPVEVLLEARVAEDFYQPAESGHVLFGWDDVNTGAVLDQSGGPNDGTWILKEADFDNLEAPNGMRLIARGTPVAIECTMAVPGWAGMFGVDARDDRPSPAPDHTLISFPIQAQN